MIYDYAISGVSMQTGDIICTVDGGGRLLAGQFWRFIGKLIPGEVDHIVIYVGPGGTCVEAGPRGVLTFTVPSHVWDAEGMLDIRGIMDTFHSVAYPLKARSLSSSQEEEIRKKVAQYCLKQAEGRKPYNLNFLNSETEDAFYCSQLAYKAYSKHNISLNTGIGVPDIPGTESIIFPQEIWSGCTTSTPT